jgi:hypothetical protein
MLETANAAIEEWSCGSCLPGFALPIRFAAQDCRRKGPGIRSVFAAVLACLFAASAMAQQSSPQTPDAPSASRSQASPAAKPDEDKVDPMAAVPVMNLLSGHSRVFPNLAVSTKPMTPKQKFRLSVENSLSTFTVLGTAAGAGLGMAMNTNSGYGQGAEGYFKRWGAGMAFSASNQLIGTYAIASLTHQDPRYFVQNSGEFKSSVRYAVSRLFVARYEDGHTGANWAQILGPLGAAGLANTYLPSGNRTVGHTIENYAISMGIAAGVNVLREYWPRINKKFGLHSMGMDTGPSTVQAKGQPNPVHTPSPKTPPGQTPK